MEAPLSTTASPNKANPRSPSVPGSRGHTQSGVFTRTLKKFQTWSQEEEASPRFELRNKDEPVDSKWPESFGEKRLAPQGFTSKDSTEAPTIASPDTDSEFDESSSEDEDESTMMLPGTVGSHSRDDSCVAQKTKNFDQHSTGELGMMKFKTLCGDAEWGPVLLDALFQPSSKLLEECDDEDPMDEEEKKAYMSNVKDVLRSLIPNKVKKTRTAQPERVSASRSSTPPSSKSKPVWMPSALFGEKGKTGNPKVKQAF